VTLEFPGPYAEDQNDIVIVTYSSINTNRMEPYGETIYSSRGTMVTEGATMMPTRKPAAARGGGAGQQLRVEAAAGGGAVLLTALTRPQSAARSGFW
jgi:hypothetical protein